MLRFPVALVASLVLQGTAAEVELCGDWRGNRSGGYGRNLSAQMQQEATQELIER